MIGGIHVPCDLCGSRVAKHIADASIAKFGKVYCYEHDPRFKERVFKKYDTASNKTGFGKTVKN